MKWQNAKFQYEDIAKLFKKDLEEAGIKTGEIFIVGDGRYYVPYLPIGEKQKEQALLILESHLW